jgi:hypothetical protein
VSRVTRRRPLFRRILRLFPVINWEMHVLQSGITRLALRRRWIGVPFGALSIGSLWLAYWIVMPVLLILLGLARLLRPVEALLEGSP